MATIELRYLKQNIILNNVLLLEEGRIFEFSYEKARKNRITADISTETEAERKIRKKQ